MSRNTTIEPLVLPSQQAHTGDEVGVMTCRANPRFDARGAVA
jgi:hypothetical protein